MYHVYPLNDLKEHILSVNCMCNPVIQQTEGDPICVHNSYDGREGLELANEILNPKIDE